MISIAPEFNFFKGFQASFCLFRITDEQDARFSHYSTKSHVRTSSVPATPPQEAQTAT